MEINSSRPTHIAVIGGGFTGLVCAFRMLHAGYRVTVFESSCDTGGLTASHNFGPFWWDKFYHCILASDANLLGLLNDLGMRDELRWTTTEVGLFSHGEMYKMTGVRDLLRFPHLTSLQKIRLALGTLFISRITNGLPLESIPLRQWTSKIFGRSVYEQIWEPLFRCELGEMRKSASAAFLWGTLRRLASTRGEGMEKKEKLGYVRGGYDAVFRRLQHQVIALGGSINTGMKVRAVSQSSPHEIGEGNVHIETAQGKMLFDAAILTVPNKAVAACLKTTDDTYIDQLRHVNYLGLICVVLVLKRRLSQFYVTNVTERVGFTGVIEMTNLIDPEVETKGYHLVYLPRYTSPDDSLFETDEAELWQHYSADLKRMFPDLEEDDIVRRFVFKERVVQPVPTIEYSRIAPPIRTPVTGVYLANTAQIINNTLNNNVMTSIADAVCERIKNDLPPQQPGTPTSIATPAVREVVTA